MSSTIAWRPLCFCHLRPDIRRELDALENRNQHRTWCAGTGRFPARWHSMSYRIEYLTETTEEDSVCHAFMSAGATLDAAESEAHQHAALAQAKGATGFQIRHLNAVDKVVAIAHFDNPKPKDLQ